jgi:hypothetical protein
MANYKKNKGFSYIGIIAVILVLVLVFGAIGWGSQGFVQWDVAKWFNSWGTEQKEEEQTESDVTINTGSAFLTKDKSNGIAVMSTSIAKDNYTVKGVSEQALEAYEVTATLAYGNVTENVAKALVDWKLAWTMPDDAGDLDVNDYVKVTTSEDGDTTAVVQILQAFDYQITLTCSLRSDEDVYAECLIDYMARPSLGGYTDGSTVNPYVVDEIGDELTSTTYSSVDQYLVIPINFSKGSTTGYLKATVTVTMADDFYTYLTNRNGGGPYLFTKTQLNKSFTLTYIDQGSSNTLDYETIDDNDNAGFTFKIDFDKFLTTNNADSFNGLKDDITEYLASNTQLVTIKAEIVERLGYEINTEDNTAMQLWCDTIFDDEALKSANEGCRLDIYEYSASSDYALTMGEEFDVGAYNPTTVILSDGFIIIGDNVTETIVEYSE